MKNELTERARFVSSKEDTVLRRWSLISWKPIELLDAVDLSMLLSFLSALAQVGIEEFGSGERMSSREEETMSHG